MYEMMDFSQVRLHGNKLFSILIKRKYNGKLDNEHNLFLEWYSYNIVLAD